jgi:hypothetical protein
MVRWFTRTAHTESLDLVSGAATADYNEYK